MAGTKGKSKSKGKGKIKSNKKQSRLAFAPVEQSSSPSSSRQTESSQPALTPSKLRYANPFTGKVTIKGQLQLEDYTRSWGNSASTSNQTELENGVGRRSTMEGEVDVRQKSSSRSPVLTSLQLHEEASSADEVVRPAKRRRVAAAHEDEQDKSKTLSHSVATGNNSLDYSTSDSDIEMAPRSSLRTPRRRSQRLVASSPTETKSLRNSLKTDLRTLGEAEESDSPELVSPGTHRKRRGRPRKEKSLEKSPSVIELDDSDDVVVTRQTRKRQKSNEYQNDNADSSSGEDIVAYPPSRRSLRKSPEKPKQAPVTPKTPRKSSQQDILDIEEDLEDLRDTLVREKRTRGYVINSARSNRQKQLEVLRRRRAGEKVENDNIASAEEEEDDDEEARPSRYSEINDMGYFDAPDSSSSDDAASIVAPDEDLDADDSSFVEDDGELGVPVNVPFEFSRHRTKHTRDCFRDVIEWMVHSKLNPAFPRNDDLYQFAFTKVSDEVVGRAGSQLMSSVWNADFLNTLRARPHLSVTGYPTVEGRTCDACNRSGHPASSDLKFSGKPYSDETLEPLDESDSDSDSSGSNSSNGADRDREGRILPSEDKHYYLGRTCKSNAVLTHTLIHWRFHLYEWVVDYLNAKEELLSNPQRSLDREKLSAKKRTKYANKVVDRMDADGEIQRLWADFHNNLRTVRDIKEFRQH